MMRKQSFRKYSLCPERHTTLNIQCVRRSNFTIFEDFYWPRGLLRRTLNRFFLQFQSNLRRFFHRFNFKERFAFEKGLGFVNQTNTLSGLGISIWSVNVSGLGQASVESRPKLIELGNRHHLHCFQLGIRSAGSHR